MGDLAGMGPAAKPAQKRHAGLRKIGTDGDEKGERRGNLELPQAM
jgi:hypothetical protein